MRTLWEPGWTEFEGDFYDAPRLTMNPTPGERIPIYVGGLSDIAFARAARHDGWIGDLYTIEEAAGHAARLAAIRAEQGATGEFAVITALTDAFLPEHFAEAEERGITDVWTAPWAYYHGMDATLDQKIEGMERFARTSGAGSDLKVAPGRCCRGTLRVAPSYSTTPSGTDRRRWLRRRSGRTRRRR